ncbi:MAG: ferritin-like domain-containing protein [Actinobacteria bacterium]|nr:ferritin-like domain-containing protein [Actinomycetota bacterium]
MNRRNFLRASADSLPGAEVLQGEEQPAFGAAPEFKNDVEILNFALVLEYFLSQLYREASGLLEGKEARYISQILGDENGHVAALTKTVQTLGGDPARTPGINLRNLLSDRDTFLRNSHKFENLFAGAYLGAARYVKNYDILQAALGIYGVEERHAAITGQLLGLSAEGGVYTGSTGTPIGKDKVLQAVKPFIKGARTASGKAAITS